MTDPENLADWLLARIAEDEETARAATRESSYGWSDNAFTEAVELAENEGAIGEATAHIARWDPARVLAECAAKKAIVVEFGSQCGGYYAPGTAERGEDEQIAADLGIEYEPHWPEKYHGYCDGCAAAQSADADHARVLRLLAQPYAGHEGFRPEWAVR